jgi:putative transposase
MWSNESRLHPRRRRRAIPKGLPPRSTLYDYFDLWGRDGTLERLHEALNAKCRKP